MKKIFPTTCFLFILLTTTACDKKEEKKQTEDFSFSGIVSDCYSSEPLPSPSIIVTGKDSSSKGFFATTTWPAGIVTTHTNGNYYLKPEKGRNDPVYYNFEISSDGYYDTDITVEVQKLGNRTGNNYPLNIHMTRVGYLKTITNNKNMNGHNDTLKLNVENRLLCSQKKREKDYVLYTSTIMESKWFELIGVAKS